MTAQGLLVEGPQGENYLLTTESNLGMEAHRLVVRKRLNGQWEDLDEIQEPDCREALIGAFVDFFVDLCRVLNSAGHPPVTKVVPIRSGLGRHARSDERSNPVGAEVGMVEQGSR